MAKKDWEDWEGQGEAFHANADAVRSKPCPECGEQDWSTHNDFETETVVLANDVKLPVSFWGVACMACGKATRIPDPERPPAPSFVTPPVTLLPAPLWKRALGRTSQVLGGLIVLVFGVAGDGRAPIVPLFIGIALFALGASLADPKKLPRSD